MDIISVQLDLCYVDNHGNRRQPIIVTLSTLTKNRFAPKMFCSITAKTICAIFFSNIVEICNRVW